MIRNRVAWREQISLSQNLGKEPLLQQPPGTCGKIEKLNAGLSQWVGPCHLAGRFDADMRIRQGKSKLDLFAPEQGRGSLHGDSEFAEVAKNAAVCGIYIHVCQGANFVPVVAPLIVLCGMSEGCGTGYRQNRLGVHREILSAGATESQ